MPVDVAQIEADANLLNTMQGSFPERLAGIAATQGPEVADRVNTNMMWLHDNRNLAQPWQLATEPPPGYVGDQFQNPAAVNAAIQNVFTAPGMQTGGGGLSGTWENIKGAPGELTNDISAAYQGMKHSFSENWQDPNFRAGVITIATLAAGGMISPETLGMQATGRTGLSSTAAAPTATTATVPATTATVAPTTTAALPVSTGVKAASTAATAGSLMNQGGSAYDNVGLGYEGESIPGIPETDVSRAFDATGGVPIRPDQAGLWDKIVNAGGRIINQGGKKILEIGGKLIGTDNANWLDLGVEAAKYGLDYMAGREEQDAIRDAAAAQERAAMAGIEEQRRQFDAVQSLLQPYVEAGQPALGQMQDVAGITQPAIAGLQSYADAGQRALGMEEALIGTLGPEAQAEAMQNLQTDPYANYMMEQAEKGVLAGGSAAGNVRGGDTKRFLAQIRPEILGDRYTQQLQRLGGLSGRGVNVGQRLLNTGESAMTNLAQLGQASGVQSASAGLRTGENVAQMMGDIGGYQAGVDLSRGAYRGSGLRDIGTFLNEGSILRRGNERPKTQQRGLF